MRWLFVLLVMLGFSHSASATCPKEEISELVGSYDFTTVVLGAKSAGAKGVNGYYRLVVTEERCALTVRIAKLGFSNTMFSRERVQYGAFPARTYEVRDAADPQPPLAMLVDAELASDAGKTLSIGFTFVGDQGFWRYLGASWDSAGMWGALVRKRIASLDDGFATPKSLKCGHSVVGGAQPVAAVFNCGDLIVATPSLDKAIWRFGPPRNSTYFYFSGQIAATGMEGNRGWVDYCYDGRDGKGAQRLVVSGSNVEYGTPEQRSVRTCGGAQRPAPTNDRWQGGVGTESRLPPICARYLATAKACFADAGDAGRAAADAFAETARAWEDAARAGHSAALEAGCREAYRAGRQMGAMCPNVRWD